MKKFLFVVFVAFSLVSCTPVGAPDNKVNIVVTLFPLYDFAKNIAGDTANVTLLLPPGTEAHSFEAKPSDIVKISKADIFIYTSDNMEIWVKDLLRGIDNPELIVVNSSKSVTTIEDEDEHKGIDPHIWLDFDNAKIMAENVFDALVKKFPESETLYKTNLEALVFKLNELDLKYKNSLNLCENKTIIQAGHFAFGYLSKRYGLNYIAAQGFSPDSEPTSKQMIEMSKQIRQYGLKYIFSEETVEPRIARTLAEETGVNILSLNAAHNISKENFDNGIGFIEIMEQNLVNILIGLNCGK